MFLIVRKEKNTYKGLAIANTIEEAKDKMLEVAQQKGKIEDGKFEPTEEGIHLIRKENTIEEFKDIVKNIDVGWLFSKKTKEVKSELVAEYMIIELSLHLNISMKSSESIELSKLNELRDFNELTGSIVAMINEDKSLTFGFSNNIDRSSVKRCTWEEIYQSVPEVRKFVDSYQNKSDIIQSVQNENNNLNKVEIARKLIPLLSGDRAVEYSEWRKVCNVLHSIDNLLLPDFIEFSRKCSHKYSLSKTQHLMRECCEYAWNSTQIQEINPLSVLHEMVKKDNPAQSEQLELKN